jgi:hypothetical protein
MNEVRLLEPSSNPVVVSQVSAPMQLIQLAMERGQLDLIDKLLDLQQRWESNEARKAYVAAMARFKAEPIIVAKDGTVDFKNKAGDRTYYKHSTLAAVVDAVVSRMGKYGLSHKWDVSQAEGHVTVSCVITHELGHSESVTMTGPRDESGNKNLLQQISSSVTYLQRYTLMSLCGLASKEMDDDGTDSGEKPGINPRGDLGKDQEAKKPGHYAERFLKAMQADKEELAIAADVYKIHMEVCSDHDFYVAISNLMESRYRGALKKYVEMHKKAAGK